MNKNINSTADFYKKVLFTNRCRLCGDVISPVDSVCDSCKNAKRPQGKLCKKCGLPEDDCECKNSHHICEYSAFAAPFYFTGSIALGLVRFKNNGYTELAEAYVDEIVKCVNERFKDVPFDCVTYVPMRKLREFRRGYNQSKLLAQGVADKLDLPLEDLLIKVHHTRTQRGSSAKERRTNLHGAFDLAKDAEVKDKYILIIDDVKTTGSTLNECAFTLRAFYAKSVYAASVAVVQPEKKKIKKDTADK